MDFSYFCSFIHLHSVWKLLCGFGTPHNFITDYCDLSLFFFVGDCVQSGVLCRREVQGISQGYHRHSGKISLNNFSTKNTRLIMDKMLYFFNITFYQIINDHSRIFFTNL